MQGQVVTTQYSSDSRRQPVGHTESPSVEPHRRPARDAVLVDALLSGDEAAFTQLVDQYHTPLLRLARVYVGDQSVAEEVVQETWLAVLKGLRSFEGRSSLKTWIFRILTNRAKSRGIREGRTVPFSSLVGENGADGRPLDPTRFTWVGSWKVPPRAWDHDTPEKAVINDETRVFIVKVIDQLPAKQRAVVSLRDVDGWRSNEVCALLDISETYQRVLLHRGRSKVRLEIERHLSDN